MFYCPDIQLHQVLPEEESAHAVRVLRLQSGDTIDVVDGIGGWYRCVITHPHPKHCEFEITETINRFDNHDHKLHIAIAPTKNIERLEWFLEKATEIGISEITPVICQFSERKIVKSERLGKIIVSAAKQSLKSNFPKLNEVCNFEQFLKKYDAAQKFIAHCYESEKVLLKDAYSEFSSVIILIGPEGDFSPDEVQKAIHNNYRPISLGSSRLRTETAGIVACHTIALTHEK